MFLRPLLEIGPDPIFLFLPYFRLGFLSNKTFIQQKKKKIIIIIIMNKLLSKKTRLSLNSWALEIKDFKIS